mgnify:CR=1 FL=1
MKSFFALALAGAVSATPMTSNDFKFMRYIVEHNKEYNTVDEYNMRKANYDFIDSEISHLNRSNGTSVHGHNKFSDYTREEYRAMLGLRNMPKPEKKVAKPVCSWAIGTTTGPVSTS